MEKPKNPAAQALGSLGGRTRSPAKAQASRNNWKKAQAALALKRQKQELAQAACAPC